MSGFSSGIPGVGSGHDEFSDVNEAADEGTFDSKEAKTRKKVKRKKSTAPQNVDRASKIAEAYGPQAYEVIRKAQAEKELKERRARDSRGSRGSTAGKGARIPQADNTFTQGFRKSGYSNKDSMPIQN